MTLERQDVGWGWSPSGRLGLRPPSPHCGEGEGGEDYEERSTFSDCHFAAMHISARYLPKGRLQVRPGETALSTWTVRPDRRTTISSTRSPLRETTCARFPA